MDLNVITWKMYQIPSEIQRILENYITKITLDDKLLLQ